MSRSDQPCSALLGLLAALPGSVAAGQVRHQLYTTIKNNEVETRGVIKVFSLFLIAVAFIAVKLQAPSLTALLPNQLPM